MVMSEWLDTSKTGFGVSKVILGNIGKSDNLGTRGMDSNSPGANNLYSFLSN